MASFTRSDVQRVTVSAIGALILSATCVIGAVRPVEAATPLAASAPLTIGAWQANVERQIDAHLQMPRTLKADEFAVAQVAVSFAADGSIAGTRIASSSGRSAIDREALRVASRIAYPALPAGMNGRARTVAIQLYFGSAPTSSDYAAHEARAQALALAATQNSAGEAQAETGTQTRALRAR